MIKDLPPIGKGTNGSLPLMTPAQKRESVKLIHSLCSYCDDGNCLYLDRGEVVTCPQCISYSVNCKFFRHVLLEDKQGQKLKAEIFKDDTVKHCSICGHAFHSISNNAKYCEDCAKSVQRKQKAKYARKQRSKVEK